MTDRGGDPARDDADSASSELRLHRWASEARTDEAVSSRTRERWLREVADQEASLVGVLTDFAERRVAVTVATETGRSHHGQVRLVGVDFVALSMPNGSDVVLALGAVSSVRAAPARDGASGDRPVSSDLVLDDILAGLVEERAEVRVVTAGGHEALAGRVRSVGRDVVVLRTDGDRPGSVYVPVAALVEITIV